MSRNPRDIAIIIGSLLFLLVCFVGIAGGIVTVINFKAYKDIEKVSLEALRDTSCRQNGGQVAWLAIESGCNVNGVQSFCAALVCQIVPEAEIVPVLPETEK